MQLKSLCSLESSALFPLNRVCSPQTSDHARLQLKDCLLILAVIDTSSSDLYYMYMYTVYRYSHNFAKKSETFLTLKSSLLDYKIQEVKAQGCWWDVL